MAFSDRRLVRGRLHRYSMIAILMLAASVGAACETFAPLVSATVEIRGPEYAYGEWGEDIFSGERHYSCQYVLTVVTDGPTSADGWIEWAGGTLSVYDEAGAVLSQRTFSWEDIRRILGRRMFYRDRVSSRPFVVSDQQHPFRWTLRVAYYDTRTGHHEEALFSSRCVGVER